MVPLSAAAAAAAVAASSVSSSCNDDDIETLGRALCKFLLLSHGLLASM